MGKRENMKEKALTELVGGTIVEARNQIFRRYSLVLTGHDCTKLITLFQRAIDGLYGNGNSGAGKGVNDDMARQTSLKEMVEGFRGRNLPKKVSEKVLMSMAIEEEDGEGQCNGDCQNCNYAEECIPGMIALVGETSAA